MEGGKGAPIFGTTKIRTISTNFGANCEELGVKLGEVGAKPSQLGAKLEELGTIFR